MNNTMNTQTMNLQELREEEMRDTNGGFFFLLPVAGALILAAVLLKPIVDAAAQGWQDAG